MYLLLNMAMFQLVMLVLGVGAGVNVFFNWKTDFPARDMLLSLPFFTMNSVKLEAFRRFSQQSWCLLGGASRLVGS